tara:strand:+ start:936 stop:1214 length:279 start_codon:yes stop_codon:yes gene_type:complete
MKNKSISESMKKFWEEKGKEFLDQANKKRSSTLKSQCVYLKKEGEKPFPCNIELILSKLSEGYLIVNTEKNKKKIYNYFGEVPDFFWAKKNK